MCTSLQFSLLCAWSQKVSIFLWHYTWMNLVVSIVISVIYKTTIKWTKTQWNFLVHWHSGLRQKAITSRCHETFQWKFVEMLNWIIDLFIFYLLYCSCCSCWIRKEKASLLLLFYAISWVRTVVIVFREDEEEEE